MRDALQDPEVHALLAACAARGWTCEVASWPFGRAEAGAAEYEACVGVPGNGRLLVRARDPGAALRAAIAAAEASRRRDG
jgi:hypothetical protein